jgi:hypothetical protein
MFVLVLGFLIATCCHYDDFFSLRSICHFDLGKKLEQIQDKFVELSFPNVHNLVVLFKHCPRGGYNDNILKLESKIRYDYIQKCCFPWKILGQKVFIFKTLVNKVGSGANLVA